MVTMFFAHGPTVLTNQVRYDTKRHFLKIFFVVYSIINHTCGVTYDDKIMRKFNVIILLFVLYILHVYYYGILGGGGGGGDPSAPPLCMQPCKLSGQC